MFAMLIAAGMPAGLPVPDRAVTFIRDTLEIGRYRAAAADLNGDGAAEIIVRAEASNFCGSGGCTLYVLSPRAGGYRIVTRMTITQPPIRVLATSTRGWRDLGVRVGGGGITRWYEARLRFDGRSYPRNPSVAPARPAENAQGRTVLD
ncbi:FG-GAP repeat protein [Sphingomonas xinjiangensis]|uniref:VCBS repeat-containing protein n=1 Tax=Sphingomonas xinjiangensis TaxID=643568 RepID=A0A840YHS8_9SPHN|nr:FG-GAP repeat protein [Sphingomonas xinjiangensis]MBB5711935.1 hypothetical protein [Sphingomonas xinjiangensis]